MLTPIAPPNYWPLRSTSSTSVTVTAGDGTIVCTNTNNATVAIPSAASLPNRIIVVKKGANNTATVTLDPDGSETIDGDTSYVLYVLNDYVMIQSDGTNWWVVGGYLVPHSCTMSRTSNESLGTGGVKVHLDTVERDNAGLADLSNNRIVVRRPAEYHINPFGSINGSTQIVQAQIYVNGSLVKTGAGTLVSQTAGGSPGYHKMFLSEGDYVELYLSHTVVGGATPPANHNRPWLSVTEVR